MRPPISTRPTSHAQGRGGAGRGRRRSCPRTQNETVITLSELIIPTTDTPGAKAAKVNEFIDGVLSGHVAPTDRAEIPRRPDLARRALPGGSTRVRSSE